MEISISNPVSKNDVYEEMSLSRASLEDAASRSGSGREPRAISNEQIVMGDTLLETYRVVSDAINGGMGSVWKVHHENWDTDLAMKRPQPRYFAEGSQQRKEAFLRECENWIDLGLHPNIVSCYYVREIGGVPAVFSEWMDGGSLRDRIHDRTLYKGEAAAGQERILSIAIQTARGLAYSHARGLNHQDVKPGNLLLSKDWDAKISDFGLAMAGAVEEPKKDASMAGAGEKGQKSAGFWRRLLGRKSDKTQPGSQYNTQDKVQKTARSSGCTPEYCPQEQADGAAAAPWMDVYAWALTVTEMYAGRRLWEKGAEAKKNCGTYFGDCRCPVPAHVKALLTRCLTEKTVSFSEAEDVLKEAYREMTGQEYAKPDAVEATATAGSLNNRALSFLDLGKPELAEKLWDEALAKYPKHLDSVFNRELYLVRSSRETDTQAGENLEKYQEAKDAELWKQIDRECGGGKQREPDCEYETPGDRAGFAYGGGNLYLPTYEQDSEYHWILQGIKRVRADDPDDWDMDPMDDIPAEYRKGRMDFYIDPGKGYAAFLRWNHLFQYDLNKRRVIAERDFFEAFQSKYPTHFDRVSYSRDSSVLGVGLRRYDQEKKIYLYWTYLMDPETLENTDAWSKNRQRRRLNLKFIGFDSKGEALMRSDRALFAFSEESGHRELCTFQSPITDTLEHVGDGQTFIAFRLEDGTAFRWDETDGLVPVTERLFGLKGEPIFFDRERGLLYRRSADYYFGIGVWDLSLGKRLYTASVYTSRQAIPVWDEQRKQILIISNNNPTQWFFLPLPEREADTQPAMWRVSGIVTSEARIGEERKIGLLAREFGKCRKQGDLHRAIAIYEECCGIEGFMAMPEATTMEDWLEKHAQRGELLGAWPVRQITGLPVLCGLDYELSATADGRTALYEKEWYNGDRKGIILFHPDMTGARFVPIPEKELQKERFFDRLAVRGNVIYAFMEDLRYAVYDLDGRLLRAPAQGWPVKEPDDKPPIWDEEAYEEWKRAHPRPKYRNDYCDTDMAGSRCLYIQILVDDRRRSYLCDIELATGEKGVLCRYDDNAMLGVRFLRDDRILACSRAGEMTVISYNGKRLEVERKWRIPVKDAECQLLRLTMERDRILVRARERGSGAEHTYIYDTEGNLLHDWDCFIPDGAIAVGGRFLFDSRLRIWDLDEGKAVHRIVPEFEYFNQNFPVRPDGRELYVRHYDAAARIGKGDLFTVYKIGYSYRAE